MTRNVPSSNARTRRSFLAAVGTGVTLSTSGCTELFTDVQTWDDQLSVTITAVPDDDDRQVNGILKHLESNLVAAGIDVSWDLRAIHQFERAILLDHEFDLYVGRYPGSPDPDSLYELLHSRFAYEPGWQNPFGLTNMELDDRLDAQRRQTGRDRQSAIADALELFLVEKPFVPICAPETYFAVNPDHFDGWGRHPFRTRLGYIDLEPREGIDRFTGLVTDSRPTQNLNPLAANFRNTGMITSLLYDSMANVRDGELTPWLAHDWSWNGDRLTVSLRPDATFHDGVPLDASDVAFTFELLADLSLGRAESPIPAARFRRETSAIRTVSAGEDGTIEFAVETSREVGSSVLTVPILPEHVWRPIVEDLDRETATTEEWLREDLRAETISRVGSGPYRFASWIRGDQLTLERFEDHFSRISDDLPSAPAEELMIRTAANGSVAIEAVDDGEASALASPIEAHVIGKTDGTETAARLSDPNWGYYHVGFNIRKPPFSNPKFRQAVASLIDREWLVETVFEGHADPIAVPTIDSTAAAGYEWDGADPETPFLGTDGDVDAEVARERFRAAGYTYDDSGQLVVNN